MQKVPPWEDSIIAIGSSDDLEGAVEKLRTRYRPTCVRLFESPTAATTGPETGVCLADRESLEDAAELTGDRLPIVVVQSPACTAVPQSAADVLSSRASADETGARVGTVLAMSRYRLGLQARTIGRLELEIRADPPLATIARSIGQRVRVLAAIPTPAGTTLYLSSERRPERDLSEIEAAAVSLVSSGEPVVYDVRCSTSPIVDQATTHGGRVRAVWWTARRCRCTVEVGNPVHTRALVEAIDESLGPTAVRGHWSVEASREDRWLAPLPIRGLTVQERRTLEAAYAGGYFEWPRDRTGEEIAASMGVAQSTFSRHLRHALESVLRVLVPRDDCQTN